MVGSNAISKGVERWLAAASSWTMPKRWPWVVLVLGLALRFQRYLLDPSIWHDEGWLILNIVEKPFAALLGPLEFLQAAPPLFLWIERAAVEALGDSTLSLRLMPLVASCAALLLMFYVSRRLLPLGLATLALLMFACSDRMLWHTAEVKPYGTDVFCTLAILAIFVRTRGWTLPARLVAFAIVCPAMMCLSYASVFVSMALCVGLFREALAQRCRAVVAAFAMLSVTSASTGMALLLGPIRAQQSEAFRACWSQTGNFADWSNPWLVPWDALTSLIGLFDYCCRPIGGCLIVFFAAGAAAWWQRKRQTEAILLVLPLVLALIAGMLGKYPSFGAYRLMLFALPSVCLLAAAGLPLLAAALQRRSPLAAGLAILPLLAPLPLAAYRIASPTKRADCPAAIAHIKEHKRSTDAVAGNDPSMHYYARDFGADYHRIPGVVSPRTNRLWIASTEVGLPAEIRNEFMAKMAQEGWQAAEQKDFLRAQVLLLVRTEPTVRTPEMTANHLPAGAARLMR